MTNRVLFPRDDRPWATKVTLANSRKCETLCPHTTTALRLSRDLGQSRQNVVLTRAPAYLESFLELPLDILVDCFLWRRQFHRVLSHTPATSIAQPRYNASAAVFATALLTLQVLCTSKFLPHDRSCTTYFLGSVKIGTPSILERFVRRSMTGLTMAASRAILVAVLPFLKTSLKALRSSKGE